MSLGNVDSKPYRRLGASHFGIGVADAGSGRVMLRSINKASRPIVETA